VICLADNDFVLKLAACDLLDETLDVLGIGRSEVYGISAYSDMSTEM
jgi:hypothetical protein